MQHEEKVVLKRFFKLRYCFTNFRVVSLSCSPTGGAFVCSAAASKKSLRSSQSKLSEMSSMLSSSITAGSGGELQCWDMKAMKVEVKLPRSFAFHAG